MLLPIYHDLQMSDVKQRFFNPIRNSNKSFLPVNPLILILAADDDLRLLFKMTLKDKKFDIREAQNIRQAFEVVEHRIPDIVLMDTQLDYEINLGELKILRGCELFDQVKFIILSGHTQPKVRQALLAAGADDFWLKPIDFDNLVRSIYFHLKQHKNNLSD